MPIKKDARKVAKKTEEELAKVEADVVKGAKAADRDLKKGAHDLRAKAKRKGTQG